MPDSSDILSRFSLETSKSGSPYKKLLNSSRTNDVQNYDCKNIPTQIPGADKAISDSVWIEHRDSYEKTNFTVTMQELIQSPRI